MKITINRRNIMDITQLVDSQRQYFMTHDKKHIQMRIKTIQNIKQWITPVSYTHLDVYKRQT